MQFASPLQPATLLRRYKRFLADAELKSGESVTVHCPNPGAMLGLAKPGARIWLSHHGGGSRKLPWSWELTEADGGLVGINTMLPNRLVAEALAAGAISELARYGEIAREVKVGSHSRIDFALNGQGLPPCLVEVKNVHLRRKPGLAEFPDSVTARGAKHLGVLADASRQGVRAINFYLVQRADCRRFAIARDLDPVYAQAFGAALQAGVEVLCYGCDVTNTGVTLGPRMEVNLEAN